MKKETLKTILDNTWEIESKSILQLKDDIDTDAVQKVLQAIVDCKGKIFTAGVGTSAAAAKKIAHTLSCVEIPATFLSPADGVHGALGVVKKDDVVIAISKGGNTEEIIKIISSIKSKQALLVGVTERENSKLAEASDILLKIKVEKEACPFNMLATTSTMAVIAVFDAIAVALMEETKYTKDQFAVIHPGGAVGERLLQKDKN